MWPPSSPLARFARTTIASAFQRTSAEMRASISRFPWYGGCSASPMVFTYGVASTWGSGTRRARACCSSRRSRKVARSGPSASINASSASTHSRVSSGSVSGSCGSPTCRGSEGSMAKMGSGDFFGRRPHSRPVQLKKSPDPIFAPFPFLLREALRLERLADRGARADALAVGLEDGPVLELHADVVGPAEEHEKITVCDRELLAHQEILPLELLCEPVEAGGEALPRDRLVVLRRLRGEERREALVHLGGEEVEPFLQAHALHRARFRGEARLGLAVGEVLHDGRALGQARAVVQLEHRDVALAVDAVEVAAAVELVRLGVDLHEVE